MYIHVQSNLSIRILIRCSVRLFLCKGIPIGINIFSTRFASISRLIRISAKYGKTYSYQEVISNSVGKCIPYLAGTKPLHKNILNYCAEKNYSYSNNIKLRIISSNHVGSSFFYSYVEVILIQGILIERFDCIIAVLLCLVKEKELGCICI